IIGGISHRGPDTGLVLKSDRAFEVRTTVAALALGDGLLSGRFGPAMLLAMPPEKLPALAIIITYAVLYSADGGLHQLQLTLGANPPGVNLVYENLLKLPHPVIFV